MKEVVMQVQGKSVREFAQKLVTGKYTIEKQSLNRYKVIEGENDNYTLINRRSFVLLDKELYKLQSRENPLAFAIEKALDNDALEFCIQKAVVDKMPVKLITRTFSSAKVVLENVLLKLDNYIIRFAVVPSVSERELTQKELEVAEYFIKANEVNNFCSDNPETPETPALPDPETTSAVDTTAKVIPEK